MNYFYILKHIDMVGRKKLRRPETNLTKAFKDLRRAGYIAKQNFTCCQTCGWYEIQEGKTDEQCEKVVFYHRQDNEDKLEGKPFNLAWCGNGQEICNILKENGVETDWDGVDTKRIKIIKW